MFAHPHLKERVRDLGESPDYLVPGFLLVRVPTSVGPREQVSGKWNPRLGQPSWAVCPKGPSSLSCWQ